MARFLLTVWPLVGHCFPAIAVADALRERGHDVAFYTGARGRKLVEQEGFRCFPFRQVDEGILEQIFFSSRRGLAWNRPLRLAAAYRSWLLGTVPDQIADLETLMAEWRPDALVCDEAMYGPILVLHQRDDIPVAALSVVTGCMVPGPEAPLSGFGLPPPHDWLTRRRAELVRAAGDLLSFNYRRTANAVRQHYGLPPLATTIREMTGRMSLNLVRGAPELDYNRRDLPPSVHYVGPLLWSPQGLETPAPWLEELPADQPLILVIGSTADKGKLTLLRAAAAGLAHRPLQVVITTGGSGSAGQLGLEPAAPNIRIAAWVPYSQVLPRTTAMVTVGGAGTVLTALNAGIPLLVVPAEADQPDNARRVVESGAGLRLSSSRCSPDRVREAVEALLAEPGYRQNATGLARVFQRYQGGTKAAELLEDMVENRGG